MLSFPKIYYVYQYFDPLREEFFYVGKGKGKRMEAHKRKNSLVKNRISWIKNKGNFPTISKFAQNLEEPDALTIEAFLIDEIGREDLGNGPLLNRTHGGEGVSGHIKTPETIAKIKQSLIGNKRSFGVPASQERKDKVSGCWLVSFPDGHQEKILGLKNITTRFKLQRTLLREGKNSKGFSVVKLEKSEC